MFEKVTLWLMMVACMTCMGVVTYYTIAVHPQQKIAQQDPTALAMVLAPLPSRVHVLAAARSVRTGSLLHAEDLASLEFVAADVPSGAQVDSPANRDDMIGALVRHAVRSGQPILQSDIIHPGDHGFLALALAPGKRAVSIGVDILSGVADLISPGDMVDVLLTQTIKEFDVALQTTQSTGGVDPNLMPAGIDQNSSKLRRTCTETVLSNVRVIAIDQDLTQGGRVAGPSAGRSQPGRTDPGRSDPGRSDSGRSDSGRTDQAGSRTVTLELAQEEAQELEIVRNVGRLSLAVVSSDPAPAVRTASLAPTSIQMSIGFTPRKVCRDVLVSTRQR